MLKIRVISAIVGLPILFFVLIKGGAFLTAALIILSIIGLNEFYNATKQIGIRPVKIFGYLSVLVIYFLENKLWNFDILVIISMILLLLLLTNRKYTIKDYALTLMGIIYIPVFFLYIEKIREIPNGMYIVWFIFIVSWMTDTFAYFTGRFFGNHKLIPSISPKKTVEGAIGGIIGSIVGCVIFALLFPQSNVSLYLGVVIGLLGSLVAQIGDLVASAIKRNCYIKDFGKIIPGHGGILDRFDSILFVSPFIYFFFQYII
ncbi:phosphatidate cytidylyltransferase CdsA [Thermoanaerobacter kivui]|uniref:Phosphatidate cytidylyltransferase n=1 Tax=Thermoanaerobacter kivui TaxID=2325 RepID=A0A097ARR1_THEKI|nr:phosphatidate cytidylyltransferase [Thermoanaerobacter kivui]AIS52494.1 phosphatidate cytidylyltransferase CdsA [Thermoanaerobacter kivui]